MLSVSSRRRLLHLGTPLTGACKALERRFERELDADLPWIVRLDGANFKRFTAHLAKPFDARFTRAMLRTARDLLVLFSAQTAFCQSDEISLFSFPMHSPVPYNGRTQKISSIAAGFASARFNVHFQSADSPAWFDARAFSCPDADSAANVAAWRHLHDCRRNAVNAAGAANFPHESLQNQSVDQVIARLKRERQIDFFVDYPKEAIFGAFLKKSPYESFGFNPVTQQAAKATRLRVEARSIDFANQPDALADMLSAKLWVGGHPGGELVHL
jgi:tRNA(His) 5'-end guanylyltransferase